MLSAQGLPHQRVEPPGRAKRTGQVEHPDHRCGLGNTQTGAHLCPHWLIRSILPVPGSWLCNGAVNPEQDWPRLCYHRAYGLVEGFFGFFF